MRVQCGRNVKVRYQVFLNQNKIIIGFVGRQSLDVDYRINVVFGQIKLSRGGERLADNRKGTDVFSVAKRCERIGF